MFHILKLTSIKLHFVKVKAYSSNKLNDQADELIKAGADSSPPILFNNKAIFNQLLSSIWYNNYYIEGSL